MRTEDPSRIATRESLTVGPCDHRFVQTLVIGTAQWGGPYGVTNTVGRLSDAVVADIAGLALAAGITRIDTAPGYGDAETRLRSWAGRFAVGTKARGADRSPLGVQVERSLESLGLARLESCLVHDWPSLTDQQATDAVRQLQALRERGVVSLIGVSAYDDTDLARAGAAFDTLDLVQVPTSALDQRLATSAVMRSLIERGTRVQARSVLLQGLMAVQSDAALARHPDVVRFHARCAELGREPLEVALAQVRSLSWVAEIVLGVTSVQELRAILAVWSMGAQAPVTGLASTDASLIDPRCWAQLADSAGRDT